MDGTDARARFGLIPSILCPVCSKLMRLKTLEAKEDGSEQMIFDCSCGFDYRQSREVHRERARSASVRRMSA